MKKLLAWLSFFYSLTTYAQFIPTPPNNPNTSEPGLIEGGIILLLVLIVLIIGILHKNKSNPNDYHFRKDESDLDKS